MKGVLHAYGLVTLVVPLKDADADRGYSYQVPIPKSAGVLHKDSLADCTHLRSVDRDERIVRKLGDLSRDLMDELDAALKDVLQLP